MQRQRVLITGACGFVGSTLALGLKETSPDWDIIGLDNLARGGSELNRSVLRRGGVKLFHGDIRLPSDLEAVPRCDWVLDAAANPSVVAGVDGKTSSRQLVEHNLVGTANLLELARQWRAGFLMLSTSRVYSIRQLAALPMSVQDDRFVPRLGAEKVADARLEKSATRGRRRKGADSTKRRENLPTEGVVCNGLEMAGVTAEGVTEQFPTEPPLSLYGATKRASELLACEYAEAFGLPVFVNRCGVLAGAGQFGKIDQGIFSFWIYSWRNRRPLKYIGFEGQGHQVRDCLHPRDLLPLVTRQMQKPGAQAPRIINVGGGLAQSASLRQLSAWCEQRFGPAPVACEKRTRSFDVPWLILDASLARRVWGWAPAIPMETIWTEIADHADRHPNWLEMTADS